MGKSQLRNCAVQILNGQGVEVLIHCGDVGPEIVPLLGGMTAHFVCGNIDSLDALRNAIRETAHTLHAPLEHSKSRGCGLLSCTATMSDYCGTPSIPDIGTWYATGTRTCTPRPNRAAPSCSIRAHRTRPNLLWRWWSCRPCRYGNFRCENYPADSRARIGWSACLKDAG